MSSTKKAAANKATLESLIGQEIVVPIGETGKSLSLQRPSRKQLVALREHLAENQEALQDKDIEIAIQETEQVVAMCVPGLDRKDAFELIMLAGGEASELVLKSFELCGLSRKELSRLAQEDPTDTSSQEQQESQ